MSSLPASERRIFPLEARLAVVEGGYGDTLYELHRASVKNDLRMSKILNPSRHPGVAEVDAAMIDA